MELDNKRNVSPVKCGFIDRLDTISKISHPYQIILTDDCFEKYTKKLYPISGIK